jgi:UrcA family protein
VNRGQLAGFTKLNRDITMKIAINGQCAALPSVIAAALVAVACAASADTTQASKPGQPLTKMVSYADLNLDTEQGASTLYHRLRFAAKEVCFPYESIELTRRIVWQTCIDRAVTLAVEQVNRPMVTAVHDRSANRASTG